MTVRVVTDSTAYLEPGVVDELDIVVVPFRVTVDGQTYLDGVDLDEDAFGHLMSGQGKEAVASSPTVEDFGRVYEELAQETSEVITILVSGTLSQACENARLAASALLGRCQSEVVDSKTVSVGLGILVETASRAAVEGVSLDEIVRIVRGGIPQIYVVFLSDTLTYLENGGRIGHAQALLGTILGIKPFLTLEEGEITPIEKVRTRDQALEKLLEFVVEFDAIKQLAIVKSTSAPDEETDLIVERLRGVFPGLDVPVLSYGPVLASHIGPDTMGIIVHESYDT